MFRTKTNKGRVVYDRPKHLFTIKDLRRIWRKIGQDPPPRGREREVYDVLVDLLIEIVRWLADQPDMTYISTLLLSLAMVLDNIVDFCAGGKKRQTDFPTGGAGGSREY